MERALLKLILLSLAIGFSLSDRECRARNAFFNPETSRCYLFLRGVWLNEAQEKCKENGYELISIENQTMNDFVLGLSRNHLKNNNVTGRVGIHYKGIPKWHHRKKVYHNFDENQGYVIHAQYIKHLCTVMNISTGLWYQIDCYKRWPALCIDRLPGSTYGNGGQQLGGGSQPGGDQPEEGGQPEVEDRPETEDPPGDEDPPGGAGEESVTPGTSDFPKEHCRNGFHLNKENKWCYTFFPLFNSVNLTNFYECVLGSSIKSEEEDNFVRAISKHFDAELTGCNHPENRQYFIGSIIRSQVAAQISRNRFDNHRFTEESAKWADGSGTGYISSKMNDPVKTGFNYIFLTHNSEWSVAESVDGFCFYMCKEASTA